MVLLPGKVVSLHKTIIPMHYFLLGSESGFVCKKAKLVIIRFGEFRFSNFKSQFLLPPLALRFPSLTTKERKKERKVKKEETSKFSLFLNKIFSLRNNRQIL